MTITDQVSEEHRNVEVHKVLKHIVCETEEMIARISQSAWKISDIRNFRHGFLCGHKESESIADDTAIDVSLTLLHSRLRHLKARLAAMESAS